MEIKSFYSVGTEKAQAGGGGGGGGETLTDS